MTVPLNYRYWKWVDFNDSDRCKGLYRDKFFPVERFWLGSWHDASDLAWRVWQDPDYVEIDEAEALALIPILLGLHQKKAERDALQVQENLRAQQIALEAAKPEEPQPMSVLLTAAIAMHELFLNFKTAGFTEDQSLNFSDEMQSIRLNRIEKDLLLKTYSISSSSESMNIFSHLSLLGSSGNPGPGSSR